MIDLNNNSAYTEAKRHRRLVIGLVLTGTLLLLTLISLFWTPYSPTAMDAFHIMNRPSFAHPFGTDDYGRDVFSRVISGSGVTFLTAFASVIIGMVIGVLIGAVSGYYGGVIDDLLNYVTNILLAFPSILLSLIFISVLKEGTLNLITAIGVMLIPRFVRITRSEVIRCKGREFVVGARCMGISEARILFRHVLPCAERQLLSTIGIAFTNAILSEAGMSYLGLGIQPPTPSLGRMLAESQNILLSAPWAAVFSGLWTTLMILGFYLISEGIDTKEGA